MAALLFALAAAGCGSKPALLIRVTADAPVEQYDLYIRDDASQEIVFHSGYNPVLAPGEKTADDTGIRDLTRDTLKIAIKLGKGGTYSLLLVGVIGSIEGGKPGAGATQLFWAGRYKVDGTTEIDARLLTVPEGDDADRDLWPDATDFRAHVAEAQKLYAEHPELLDCYDKELTGELAPKGADGMPLSIRAETVNPFAVELCGDGYDENCNGLADEPCVDEDDDGSPRGMDCDDKDPARHKANGKDLYPDPPNCCGYSLGKTGAEERQSFAGDPLLCPASRCGDGVDNGCRGTGANDPANDTTCVVDADCDGYPSSTDCDDADPNAHPGAVEICGNGKSESCAKVNDVVVADFGCVPCDLDGDGYQRNDLMAGCPDVANLHAGKVDCNDNDSGIYPGSADAAGMKEGGVNSQGRVATALKGLCRRVYEATGVTGTAKVGISGFTIGDADCNGMAYEACPPVTCDADGDGWPKDGSCGQSGPYDCNDADPTIFPSAPDRCDDGIDGNCSGADTPCMGLDKDGDKYLPPGDCDDMNAAVHPFAVELCNGVDDDCDGDKDEGNPAPDGKPLVTSADITTCTDSNIGECGKTLGRCVCSAAEPKSKVNPASRVACPGDTPGTNSPHCFGAGQPSAQTCGAVDEDNDCNGSSSDLTGTNLVVKDLPCGLDVGPCKKGLVTGCNRAQVASPYFGAQATADNVHWICAGTTNPAPESCNGIDDDCNGALPNNELDPDMDKYIGCAGCGAVAAGLLGCNDCDQAIATTNPGAMDKCDGVDNDCNAVTTDGSTECGLVAKTCCFGNGGGNTCRDLNTDFNYCSACTSSCAGSIFVNACAGGGCVCGATGAACTMGVAGVSPGKWCDAGACTTCDQKAHCGATCIACGASQVCKADGSGCTGCNTDADCSTATWCSGGNCVARNAQGGTCTVVAGEMAENPDHECLQTGAALYCTDGRCCTSAPSACGLCRRCNLGGGLNGTCNSTPAGQEEGNECVANMANCQQDKCNGAGSCAVADNTNCETPVVCNNAGAESYTWAFQCTAGTCDATRSQITLCGDYECSGNACLTTCTSDADCHNPAKPNCWTAAMSGAPVGRCYAKATAGEICATNSDCESGACVGTRCCGTTARPATCGAGTTTTTCSGLTLTTYTCSSPNYNSCTSANTSCTGDLTCANAVSCEPDCNCATSPCSTTQCRSGFFCPTDASASCNACTTTAFCGATCVACTPACAAGMISGTACTGGTACSAAATCPGNFTCQNATSCKTSCASDADCTGGRWCKTGTNTCETRIAATMNCDDADCAVTGCLQCNMGGTGVICPLIAPKKCPAI